MTGADDYKIPGKISDSALEKAVLEQPEHNKRDIRRYVELEAKDEKVTHLEKIHTESILGKKHIVWDVRTNKSRYWVITNPTNLYDQTLFPSMDYTLSFHIGVTLRISAKQANKKPEQTIKMFGVPWRIWEKAAQNLDEAEEIEEFQAVGMTCRECLVALSKSLASSGLIKPSSVTPPKAGDFIQWVGLFADTITLGHSSKETRSYLKSLADSTWKLVNWMTHSKTITWFDGIMAVDAVSFLLNDFEWAFLRFKRGMPKQCPECSSLRVVADFRPDLGIDPPYVSLCESCGWTDYNPDSATD